jgi:hypothetical protein
MNMNKHILYIQYNEYTVIIYLPKMRIDISIPTKKIFLLNSIWKYIQLISGTSEFNY